MIFDELELVRFAAVLHLTCVLQLGHRHHRATISRAVVAMRATKTK